MTGPEHYSEAQRMAAHAALEVCEDHEEDAPLSDIATAYIGLAQVHATLAVAAALADMHLHEVGEEPAHMHLRSWERVIR